MAIPKAATRWRLVWRDTQTDKRGRWYGLSLWENDDGRLAVKDMSGSTPDTTDDGPLYLAFGRPIRVDVATVGMTCSIPVTNAEGGADYWTYMPPADAASLLAYLHARKVAMSVEFTPAASTVMQGLMHLAAYQMAGA